MPRSERVLYASFLRVLRQFRSEQVPLTGIAGSPIVVQDCRPLQTIRRLFRSPSNVGIEGGLRLLSVLQTQLETLVSAEEETREALAEWEQLVTWQEELESKAGQDHGTAAAAALAAERGMQLLVQQASRLDGLFSAGALPQLEELKQQEGEEGEDREGQIDGGQGARTLEGLAEEVQERFELVKAAGSSGLGLPAAAAQPPESLLMAQALSAVVYGRHKFRYRPFEWVYDGLQPLMLPALLQRRLGAPLSLAVLSAAVGRRAGLALTPIPAAHPGAWASPGADPAAAQAAALGTGLAPQLAAKLAKTGQEVLPLQPPWLLRVEAGGIAEAEGTAGELAAGAAAGAGASAVGQQYCYMDASTGELLDLQAAAAKYPAADLARDWALLSPLAVWQAMVRTIVQAHQRRGESDLVAHWTYVLLALDPQAEEWKFML